MKKFYIISLIILGFFFYSPSLAADDARLSGRILLQVEKHGEAWYVNPADNLRYYLGRPNDAFRIMRNLGIGISNQDLKKIPIGLEYISGNDSDHDGLNNRLENAIGTRADAVDTDKDGWNDFLEIENNNNPLGAGKMPLDKNFANQHLGEIFLQVQNNGEAWYVNPVNGKRYFLGLPVDAYNLMRSLGLGITNNDLNNVVSREVSVASTEIEKQIHDLVNQEREKAGLKTLVWNSELASVAREHSKNLAEENMAFTKLGMSCDYPIIHHEGTVFGLYNSNRLNNRGIQYFSRAGENIALLSRASLNIRYQAGDIVKNLIDECQSTRIEWDADFKEAIAKAVSEQEKIAIIKAEDQKRKNQFLKSIKMEVKETEWLSDDFLATESVKGWMESPGHKENILNSEYDEAGIGAAYTDGYFIVTQSFIKRTACGFSGGPCCVVEGYYPYCYVPLSCNENVCGGG
jgi:hypothetical protein